MNDFGVDRVVNRSLDGEKMPHAAAAPRAPRTARRTTLAARRTLPPARRTPHRTGWDRVGPRRSLVRPPVEITLRGWVCCAGALITREANRLVAVSARYGGAARLAMTSSYESL